MCHLKMSGIVTVQGCFWTLESRCVKDFYIYICSHLVDELKQLALPFLQILLQHICFQVNSPANTRHKFTFCKHSETFCSLKCTMWQQQSCIVIIHVCVVLIHRWLKRMSIEAMELRLWVCWRLRWQVKTMLASLSGCVTFPEAQR